MLPSLVVKIEFCRALHRGSKEPIRPGSLSSLPSACTPRRADRSPISGFLALKIPSVSTFSAAFLTETRIAPRGLRQCTALAVPSLVCLDEETGIQLDHSFRAASSARASCYGLSSGATNVNFGPFPTSVPGPFFVANSVCPRPFLTGSAPQTELTVTHSKQTLEKILTGARTHIKLARRSAPSRGGGEFANPHFSAPENLLLHRRPIQIFLRPTI